MTIAKELNSWLKAIYDLEDQVYKTLISDPGGVPDVPINSPMDYNIGAIASAIEYLRNANKLYLNQIFLDQASGEWLRYILLDFFGITRHENETDDDWRQRSLDIIFGPKGSPAAIIYNTRKFSTSEPVIIEGEEDSAFCDVTFADYYEESFYSNDRSFYVMPAVVNDASAGSFYFELILEGTNTTDIPALIETVENTKMDGIDYVIKIR